MGTDCLVRTADHGDLPVIIQLWQTGFPKDTETEIRTFFHAVFSQSTCLIGIYNGTPATMLFMLPARWRGLEILPLTYIYAGVTIPLYRGRGFYSALLREAITRSRTSGAAGVYLRPASAALFDYYQKLGFEPYFYRREEYISAPAPQAIQKMPVATLTTDEYAAMRTQRLNRAGFCHVCFSEAITGYAAAEYIRIGWDGGCALIKAAAPDGCATVREMLAEDRTDAIKAIAAAVPAAAYQMITPPDGVSPAAMCGMLYRLDGRLPTRPGQPYMGLTME